MDVARLVILAIALLLLAFTLGAVIAWRLEGRERRTLPMWLVVTQHTSWLALVAYIATGDPPAGVMAIDAAWWNLMKLAIVIGSIAVFALEIRHTLRSRRSA